MSTLLEIIKQLKGSRRRLTPAQEDIIVEMVLAQAPLSNIGLDPDDQARAMKLCEELHVTPVEFVRHWTLVGIDSCEHDRNSRTAVMADALDQRGTQSARISQVILGGAS